MDFTALKRRLVNGWRRVRRAFSRSEWAVRLLRLSRWSGPSGEPGIVLIQIDGLSRVQLERAMNRRRMRFLRRLLRRKRYRLHTLYSGIPSATPAVQGELFYGVRSAVPSFHFCDHETGQPVRMFDPAPTAKVQARLSERGNGLLEGGSAWCDIFSGGAAEPHFCPSEFGWGKLWRAVHPLRFTVFMLLYIDSAIRVAAMMAIEFVVAIVDCARGLIARQYLWKELGMVPSRVAVGVLLRELLTIGAEMDAARGLPIIHLNFLGYDEQSHRRGPASAFAHWSLRGIDRSIRRTFRVARRSRRRNYQVWFYSDHGQERCVAYDEAAGKSLQQAVAEAFQEPFEPSSNHSSVDTGAQYHRSKWAGGDGLQKILRGRELSNGNGEVKKASARNDGVRVTGMGSLAQVYCPDFASTEHRDEIARRLIVETGIPLLLSADGENKAWAWNTEGRFHLPKDAAKVLGADHPFRDEVADDLIAVCHHPDAGQFVLCGWARNGRSLSFSHETGCHAGPGVDETRAWVMLPRATDVSENGDGHLRPGDLRQLALQLLGRKS